MDGDDRQGLEYLARTGATRRIRGLGSGASLSFRQVAEADVDALQNAGAPRSRATHHPFCVAANVILRVMTAARAIAARVVGAGLTLRDVARIVVCALKIVHNYLLISFSPAVRRSPFSLRRPHCRPCKDIARRYTLLSSAILHFFAFSYTKRKSLYKSI